MNQHRARANEPASALINTPLQRGETAPLRTQNRFSGFAGVAETAEPGYFTPRTIRRHGVAADGSRRTLSAAKTAPTAVGGYLSMKYPGEAVQSLSRLITPLKRGVNESRVSTEQTRREEGGRC